MTTPPRRTAPVARRLLLLAVALGLFDLALLAWRVLLADANDPWVVPLRVVSTLLTLALVGAVALALVRLQQAQGAVRLQTERERVLLDALPIGLVVWDADDRFVTCNADFRALYPALVPHLTSGLRFEDLLRHSLAAGLVPEAAGREPDWLAQRLAQHRRPGAPIVRRMADGRWRRMVEQRLPDGTLLSHSIDVTELVDKERALEAARQDAERARRTLVDAVEALPAGFELYDAEDRLVMTNHLMREMYPLIADLADQRPSFEEVVRANFARGGIPEPPEGFEAWFAERRRTRASGLPPHVRQQADGRWIRVHESRTSDGGVVGVRIDVTELEQQRLALERARADAEQARRTLIDAVEALPAGFELYDADDRLVMVNEVMRRMYPRIADLWERGLTFEQLVRANHERGGLPPLPVPFEDWLAERLRLRRGGGPPRVHQLADGRWVRTYERPLGHGGLVGVRIDVTELQRLNAELGRLSETDALTELANRRLFDQRLAEELMRARRHGTPLALAIADVDHFKRYNDRHGHLAGDACLKQVAAVLRDTARRPGDLVARLGGEEFVLLLPDDDADAAAALGERCVAALDHAALPHGDSPVAPQVTISIGVADLAGLGAPALEGDASALLRAADQALYAAKQAGRHRVVVAPRHPAPA
ncbi:MAG: PAS-domain containing protein [Rubrivivax sp.]|nr:PAS-domain containing protein [Rubrivivax sp.]